MTGMTTGVAVGLVLKATLILGLGLAADRWLRGASPALRHLSWTAAVAAALCLPLLTAVVPTVGVPAPAFASALEREAMRGTPPGGVAGPAPGGARAEGGEPIGPAPLEVDPTAQTVRQPGPGSERAREEADPASAAAEDSPVAAGPGSPGSTGLPLGPLWAAGTGLVLLWLLACWLRVVLRVGRTPVFEDPRVRAGAARMSRSLGLSTTPTLLRGPASAMPCTLGLLRPRILLPAGAEEWDGDRLDAVLAHELAHVRRRDPVTQLLAGLACALYWFHPLAWIAARRMETEREYACDDEVLRLGARPSAYAGCLVELARAFRDPGLPAAVSTSMARSGGLSDRVRSILAATPVRGALTRRRVVGAAVCAGLLVVPLSAARAVPGDGPPARDPGTSPALTVPAGAADAGGLQDAEGAPVQEAGDPYGCWVQHLPHSMSVNHGREGWRIEWEVEGCVSRIRLRPAIAFTPDFDWVETVGDGGLLRVDETVSGVHRKVEFLPGDGGDPEVRFWRDGRRAEIDDDARRWIEARLLTVIRQTGVAAEERTARILEREGVEGVLAEVSRMNADASQERYLTALLNGASLDDDQLVETLEIAAHRVGSDERLASVLVATAARYRASVLGPARRAFLDAAEGVGSDGRHTRMLRSVVDGARDEGAATRSAVVVLALESAEATVGSDGLMADFLLHLVRSRPGLFAEPVVVDRFRAALATVGSDGHQSRVLTEMVDEARDAGGEAYRLVVEMALESAADRLGSDGRMADFLVHLARGHGELLDDDGLAARFRRALDTVGSDRHEERVRSVMSRSVG